ncbi:MAG TPA: hypothetical protein VNK26_00850 [Pyrinomonadaceae bacterium]|nr:hypothetical protein [Pyrinomonadaceae bacterium]
MDSSAQTRRQRIKPQPTPPVNDIEVISRADDPSQQNQSTVTKADTAEPGSQVQNQANTASGRMTNRQNQAGRPLSAAEKRQMLAANVELMTKVEQRVDELRKQLFSLIEKENNIRLRLDQIEIQLRPESIEREVAIAGSLRPEELRQLKRKSLESEKQSQQNLLTEVLRARSAVELSLQKAELFAEKLRSKLESEIDDALTNQD